MCQGRTEAYIYGKSTEKQRRVSGLQVSAWKQWNENRLCCNVCKYILRRNLSIIKDTGLQNNGRIVCRTLDVPEICKEKGAER